jgi:hypothetical protein
MNRRFSVPSAQPPHVPKARAQHLPDDLASFIPTGLVHRPPTQSPARRRSRTLGHAVTRCAHAAISRPIDRRHFGSTPASSRAKAGNRAHRSFA